MPAISLAENGMKCRGYRECKENLFKNLCILCAFCINFSFLNTALYDWDYVDF